MQDEGYIRERHIEVLDNISACRTHKCRINRPLRGIQNPYQIYLQER